MDNPPRKIIEQVKDAINKSGFPLEMKVDQILKPHGWYSRVGKLYRDFITEKIREIDIYASKVVNGTQIEMVIACKQSEQHKLVLYTPQLDNYVNYFLEYFKGFPSKLSNPASKYSNYDVSKAFYKLDLIKNSIPLAKKLIVCMNEKVTDANQKYLSDFDSIIKYAISRTHLSDLQNNFRIINFFIMIFDGDIFSLTPSKNDKFDLKQIDYGKILYTTDFRFTDIDQAPTYNHKRNIKEVANRFGDNFVIEIMTPAYFDQYLNHIQSILSNIDQSWLQNWGRESDLPF